MVKKLYLPNIFLFEWDEGNLSHIRKHNVEYSECENVFYDEPIFFYDESHSLEEDRFLIYGVTDAKKELTLVFTVRKDKIRVITARNQSRREKQAYFVDDKE